MIKTKMYRTIQNIILGASLVFFLGACQKNKEDHNGHEDAKSESKKEYTCAMHPQIRSDKEGSCPICGMDLVLIDSSDENMDEDMDEHQGHEKSTMAEPAGKGRKESSTHESLGHNKMIPKGRTELKLSFNRQQMIGVKTDKVIMRTLSEVIKAPGRIAFDPELYTAQSEYLEALRQQRKVRKSPLREIRRSTSEMVRSSKTRLKVLGLGNDDIRALGKKGRVSDGLIVGTGSENLIYAEVFESDLSKIKKGQKVKIRASFIPGKALDGEVISVDQLIDPKTRSGKVRIKINKTDLSIRPEAFVMADIFVPLGKHVSVPVEAVFDTGKDIFVFIKKGKGKFEPRVISKIFETVDFVAILKGVDVGDEVVTSANFMIDSESRLKSVFKSSTQPSGHNH